MSISLTVKNQTAGIKSYIGGAFTVAANGQSTASATQIFPLAVDPQLVADCATADVLVSDGVSDYKYTDAINYLLLIRSSLGGQVIGYTGAPVPNFCILVGGKDNNGNIIPGSFSATGGLLIAGNVASGAADTGSPIKVGAVYNSSLPSFSDGDRADNQANAFGETAVQFRNKFYNQSGNATHTVKSGSGRLHGIMVNKNWTNGSLVVYDNTAGSGTVIATFDFGSPSGGLLSSSGIPGPCFIGPLGLEFSTGLTIVTSGSSNNNVTILYQ